MRPAVSMNGLASTDWLRCSIFKCKTFYDTSVPMGHQAMIHMDPHERLGIFGAYGSGKTVTTFKKDETHILITPFGETLVGANTLVQLENTIKKDLESDFPVEFVKRYNKQKNKVQFINGHILYYRHLADEGDLRSYNLTRAHILEASEVKHESYVQLQSRTRNDRAMIPLLDKDGAPVYEYNEEEEKYEKVALYDWRQMVIESNPDSGWIKDDVLLKSDMVYVHHETDQTYIIPPAQAEEFMSTHIIPTRANYHLPANFVKSLSAGKPDWWIKRYILGSFMYSEGLVYPHAVDAIVPRDKEFEIKDVWQRLIGFDYGLNDNSHYIFAAIDWRGENPYTKRPAVIFYTELVRNNMNIHQLAMEYKREIREHVPVGSLYRTPVMDGRSHSLRQKTGEKKTLGHLFKDEGCYFNPAQMDLNARIIKMNSMIDNGELLFFESGVPHFLKEILKYKFPDKTLETSNKNTDKPIDKDNHGINAGEFLCMETPRSLKEVSTATLIAGRQATTYRDTIVRRRRPAFHPLEDNAEEDYMAEGFASAFDY